MIHAQNITDEGRTGYWPADEHWPREGCSKGIGPLSCRSQKERTLGPHKSEEVELHTCTLHRMRMTSSTALFAVAVFVFTLRPCFTKGTPIVIVRLVIMQMIMLNIVLNIIWSLFYTEIRMNWLIININFKFSSAIVLTNVWQLDERDCLTFTKIAISNKSLKLASQNTESILYITKD